MTEFLAQHFDSIVKAVKRVVQEPQSFIEIKFSVLTVRVYPSRAEVNAYDDRDEQHWRLKYLTSFMLALSEALTQSPTQFAFLYGDDELSIGIASPSGMYWMPCTIASLDRSRDMEPASARFSFDDETTGQFALSEFRRIRL